MDNYFLNKIIQWNDGEITQWNESEKPNLSTNEAIVVWFCTGGEPKNLPDAPPFVRLMYLTPDERKFIDDFILDQQEGLGAIKKEV